VNRERSHVTSSPLPKKLGIKEGSRIALVGAPTGFECTLAPLPPGVDVVSRPRAGMDVILFFTARRSELERRFLVLARALDPAGGLWIAWPKKDSEVKTDLDQAAVMDVGLATGLVDNKVCAIDETWSALRFVVRRENREGWPPARS
jgi:hypothetical protein